MNVLIEIFAKSRNTQFITKTKLCQYMKNLWSNKEMQKQNKPINKQINKNQQWDIFVLRESGKDKRIIEKIKISSAGEQIGKWTFILGLLKLYNSKTFQKAICQEV